MFTLRSFALGTPIVIVGVLLTSLLGAEFASAQVPRLLHYQATLAAAEGPVEGPADVRVAFYPQPSGGTPIADWQETHRGVPLSDGRVDLLLGSRTPLPSSVFETQSLYLEVSINGDAMPRLPVASTAFAVRAGTAEEVAPQSINASALASGAVTSAALADNAVTARVLAPGHVITALNGLTNEVELVAGDNVSIDEDSEAGTITIEADDRRWSSRRWKADIEPLQGLALVQQLRGVRYRWIDSGVLDLGVIAEEVGAVVPEVVTYAPNGVDAETVDYARLVALLIEAIKEQQAQIETDRSHLREIRTRVEALEEKQEAQ